MVVLFLTFWETSVCHRYYTALHFHLQFTRVPMSPHPHQYLLFSLFFKRLDLFNFFLERGEGREKEKERKINVWLPLMCPLLGTWPTIQACALTGNQTRDLWVHRLALNPLSHTSQRIFSLIVAIPMHVIMVRSRCEKINLLHCPLF